MTSGNDPAELFRKVRQKPRVDAKTLFCYWAASEMNFPAASHEESMNDTFYPNAASCVELNPADFAFSTAHSL